MEQFFHTFDRFFFPDSLAKGISCICYRKDGNVYSGLLVFSGQINYLYCFNLASSVWKVQIEYYVCVNKNSHFPKMYASLSSFLNSSLVKLV